jgi:hypothetical protein
MMLRLCRWVRIGVQPVEAFQVFASRPQARRRVAAWVGFDVRSWVSGKMRFPAESTGAYDIFNENDLQYPNGFLHASSKPPDKKGPALACGARFFAAPRAPLQQ